MGAPATIQKSPGPWVLMWRKLRKNRVAMTGLWILIAFYTASCFAGFLAPYSFDDADTDTAKAGPMLFGGFVHEPVQVPSEIEDGKMVTEYRRTWSWFEGGVHFHDSDGNFSLRPHVHPLVEKQYEDAWGDTSYSRAAADRSVSLPIEFFVESEKEHELFSLMGVFPIKGRTHLFGVRAPAGTPGVARVYLFGSDETGRDIYSRLLYGGQISLSIGILGILISMSIGLVVGGLSGYFGGKIDFLAMRVVEVILSIPGLYLLIVLGNLIRSIKIDEKPLSSTQIYLFIVLAMATIGWASNSRVIRGMVLSLKENDYVMAARAAGVGHFTIIIRHILPNTFSFVIVTATLYVPYYILSEVALSFLGLGIQEPEASWGNMLREAQSVALLTQNPWIVAPGVLIFITVLAYNFLGDGLRDAADPKAVIVRKRKQTDDDEEDE